MLRFFRYSGSKIRYVDLINEYINNSKKSIYIEPFVGSGAVLFNLEKTFDKYFINDLDTNIFRIYETFKTINFQEYVQEQQFVKEKFGDIKEDKKSYYDFRDWFNQNFWKSGTEEEGIYLHFLTNSCINSFLRFGPNGMNQSFGGRFYTLNEKEFNSVKHILRKTEISNLPYQNLMDNDDALYFLDPPYFSQGSSYSEFSEKDLNEFIEILKVGKFDFVYTDILNEMNRHLEFEVIREMVSTAPSTNKQKNGNMECLFYSKGLELVSEWF